MAKAKLLYICSACGSSHSKWAGQCGDCGDWNTMVEGVPETGDKRSGFAGKSNTSARIQQLEDIVYQYDGNNHEPKHVKLLWGSLIFYGRLTTMTVEYTLFEPSGKPLRAKVKLAFTGFMSKEERALRANKSSPDLTHYIEFKAGDTLIVPYDAHGRLSIYALRQGS